jgi:hypothetical protein
LPPSENVFNSFFFLHGVSCSTGWLIIYPVSVRHSLLLLLLSLLLSWLYSPSLVLGWFNSFVRLYRGGSTPWTGISPSQAHYLKAGQQKYVINTHRHPCLN